MLERIGGGSGAAVLERPLKAPPTMTSGGRDIEPPKKLTGTGWGGSEAGRDGGSVKIGGITFFRFEPTKSTSVN